MVEQAESVIDWRQKSDEAFALVKLLRDPESKELMLAIARGYEALAHYSESHRAKVKSGHGTLTGNGPLPA